MGVLARSEILVSCHEVEAVSKHMYTRPWIGQNVLNGIFEKTELSPSSVCVTSWHINWFFFCMVWADKLLFHLCEKWFHFHACTFSVTQQQVRTKLCSSDSSTFSSPSSSSPVPLCPIRELMAFPMSQNEGGTSATNSHEACVEKIKPH